MSTSNTGRSSLLANDTVAGSILQDEIFLVFRSAVFSVGTWKQTGGHFQIPWQSSRSSKILLLLLDLHCQCRRCFGNLPVSCEHVCGWFAFGNTLLGRWVVFVSNYCCIYCFSPSLFISFFQPSYRCFKKLLFLVVCLLVTPCKCGLQLSSTWWYLLASVRFSFDGTLSILGHAETGIRTSCILSNRVGWDCSLDIHHIVGGKQLPNNSNSSRTFCLNPLKRSAAQRFSLATEMIWATRSWHLKCPWQVARQIYSVAA